MVFNGIRNFLDIHTEYFKLSLRKMRKPAHCPMCKKKISKISTLVLCKRCDEKFSRYSDDLKRAIVEKLKDKPNKTRCVLCNKKNLESDNRLIYCADCDISFHL